MSSKCHNKVQMGVGAISNMSPRTFCPQQTLKVVGSQRILAEDMEARFFFHRGVTMSSVSSLHGIRSLVGFMPHFRYPRQHLDAKCF